MDKREVLRRLDQLRLELRREEDGLRELCKEQDDYTSLYYYHLGKISGVRWARWALEEVRSAIAHADDPPEVTEMCPSCGKEVTIIWDTEKDGYRAYCPYCGEWLMLCSACHDDGHECDYDSETDECRWNPTEGEK